MTKHRCCARLLLFGSLVFLGGLSLRCQNSFAAQPYESSGKWVKLGRGLSNIVTSPAELIYQPYFMSQNERAPIAIFGGVGKGLAYMVGRIVTGVYETVTFPVPIPAGYRPIIEPDVPIPRDVDSGSRVV